jgi:hypothetical protein
VPILKIEDITTGILLILFNPVNPVQKFDARHRAVLVAAAQKDHDRRSGGIKWE